MINPGNLSLHRFSYFYRRITTAPIGMRGTMIEDGTPLLAMLHSAAPSVSMPGIRVAFITAF